MVYTNNIMPKVKINPLTVRIAILCLVLVGAGVWYWHKGKFSPPTSEPRIDQKTADISLGSRILEKTHNLIKDKLPETNPFSNTETNPLKRVIKNPF